MAGRVYDTAQWKRLRRLKLAASPLCEECEGAGRLKAAVAVDHVIPTRLGGPAFPPLSGLRSLCFRCHNQKTARGPEAGAVRTDKPLRGCDAHGRPLDPNHPWRTSDCANGRTLVTPQCENGAENLSELQPEHRRPV
jgi:5-methylcytosine-specific restriction protein A